MSTGPRALVLAAGQGRRMGGPKARLLLAGAPLVLRHVERLGRAVDSTLVVARPEDVPWLQSLGLEARESRAPDQAGSLAVGVRALAAQGHDACVLVVPVDTLPASEETLWRLRRALAHGVDAVCPTFGGRGGHPVLVREQVLATYRARGTPPPLREVLAALGARWLKLPVQDSAVATDLDEPADVERLTGHGPRFAETPFPLRAVLARLPTVRP